MTDFPKLHRIKQDDENMEKIHIAARKGQTEIVRRLVSMGINPNIQNRFGCTALHLACKFGHLSTAKELATQADANVAWHGQKPLHLAALSGNVNIVKALVDGAKEQGRSPESVLNECDELEVTEVGDHPKKVSGQTALHWCVSLDGMEAMVKHLLSLGASANAKDKNGDTVFMRVIEFNNAKAFDLMTHEPFVGALRIDTADKKGRTALSLAIIHNRPQFASKLLLLGPDVAVEDETKQSPFSYAVRGAMAQVLDHIFEMIDPFVVQSSPYHNGQSVLADRIDWLPFVEDSHKVETIKVFQKRLDQLSKGAIQRSAKGPTQMSLAPSAPIRKS